MAAYKDEDTEFKALTVELLHRSATLQYGSEQDAEVKRVWDMLDARYGPGAVDRLADEITGRHMTPVEAVVWAATEWPQVAEILGAAPEPITPGMPEWTGATKGVCPTCTVTTPGEACFGCGTVAPGGEATESVCSICNYETGHWPYCPRSLPVDWANLGEPYRSDLAAARTAAPAADEDESGIADEQAIDMDEVVRILREVHHVEGAHVQHTGGGCMTIYAAPIGEQPEYGMRYAVCAGPGFYQRNAPSLGWTEEFCFGNDDEDMTDVVYVKDVCEDPADEAEVARHIAEFVAVKRGCECGMPGGVHSKGCPDPAMEAEFSHNQRVRHARLGMPGTVAGDADEEGLRGVVWDDSPETVERIDPALLVCAHAATAESDDCTVTYCVDCNATVKGNH